jgi:hypothetical protein
MLHHFRHALLLLALAWFTPSFAQNLLNNPESVVFDSLHNCHLVSNYGDGAIVRIDSNGTHTYFSTELLGQYGLAGLYLYGDTLLAAAGNAPDAGIAWFDLATGEMILFIVMPDVGLPNDITSDSSGLLYVTDYWGDKLYKIVERNPYVYMTEGLNFPNGMTYDPRYHRLLIDSVMGPGAPILAVNLADSTLTTVVTTGLVGGTDGIALDCEFNCYVSEWTNDTVVMYDSAFANPVVFSSGHDDPADIYFDRVNNQICVPNFSANTVDFVPLVASPVNRREGSIEFPIALQLLGNYPNPFNASTTISYTLPTATTVTLSIYDLNGRLIETLLNGWRWPGIHEIRFDTNILTSGVYWYRLQAAEYTEYGSMLLLK